jgi:hypothetical protein
LPRLRGSLQTVLSSVLGAGLLLRDQPPPASSYNQVPSGITAPLGTTMMPSLT